MKKFFVIAVLCLLVNSINAFAAVGETYDQMARRYEDLARVSISQVAGAKDAARYRAAGAKSYSFTAGPLKVYAVFNSNGICFKMLTLHNRALPKKSLLIGAIANTAPKMLFRIPRWAVVLQYGTGTSAVIYRSFGLPGNLSAEAVYKALEP